MRRSIPSLNVIDQVDLLSNPYGLLLIGADFACAGLAIVHWEKPDRRRILGCLQIYSSLCRDPYFHFYTTGSLRARRVNQDPRQYIAERPGPDPEKKYGF